MKIKKYISFTLLSILLLIQLIGCGQEKHTINQISPFERNNISVISITQGNSGTKELANKELIDSLIGSLEKIKFSKASTEQEAKILNNGQKFNLNSTLTIELMENKQGKPQALIVSISDKELILTDSKTMGDSRTVSYINQNDELTLGAVKEIYLLTKRAIE